MSSSQNSTLWILVVSVSLSPGRFRRRKAWAAVLAPAGVLLETLG